MKVEYRKLFLKDLKKLKNQPIYEQIIDIVLAPFPFLKNDKILALTETCKYKTI